MSSLSMPFPVPLLIHENLGQGRECILRTETDFPQSDDAVVAQLFLIQAFSEDWHRGRRSWAQLDKFIKGLPPVRGSLIPKDLDELFDWSVHRYRPERASKRSTGVDQK